MGAIFAIPSTLNCAVQTLIERGVKYCVLYCISYIYLSFHKLVCGRRFDLYDYNDDDPEKNGFFVPHEEWELETPNQRDQLERRADDAFCCGANSSSEALAVRVARLPGSRVQCSLFLRLSDGRAFSLPQEHTFQRENSEDYTFGSSRLKLQCLIPMRKWRIFFNGILRECTEEDESYPKYQHVTFTFIATSSSGAFDFSTDMSKALLSHSCLESSADKQPFAFFRRLKDIFDCYEQSVMILGTYTMGKEEEKEMYLWGTRGRYMEKKDLNAEKEEVYGNFQDGTIVHLGLMNADKTIRKFTYGFVMASNGFIDPVENLCYIPASTSTTHLKIKFFSDDTNYELEIKKPILSDVEFQKEDAGKTTLSLAEMTLNDMTGRGFLLKGKIQKTEERKDVFLSEDYKYPAEVPLTVTFDQTLCQNPALTGGKGSSLGKLHSISKAMGKLAEKTNALYFEVPKGVVVTTEAYAMYTRGNLGDLLKRFQKTVWSDPEKHSKEHCQIMKKEVSEADLPAEVTESIKASLNLVFGDKVAETKLAVRSSATGEDTEQMSAAGQMETFLGLKGIEEILRAVKKCWASQFDLPAVEYKRRYGQLLNTPMAVVIQEMVACDVAGVAFTCDPVNGNPLFISLTANWGLGESVVSATSEPDTVVLERDLNDNINLHSQQLGRKHAQIVMDENMGTKVVELAKEQSSDCCLSEEMSVRIGKIAAKVEEMYGSPRDIEWGIVNQKVFLFQARPITSLDRDTDFEIRHMFDTFRRCEKEYLSKANVGEVMPGASSPLAIDFLPKMLEIAYNRQFLRFDKDICADEPYFQKRLITAYNHVFFCVIDSFLQLSEDDTKFAECFMISLFGRPIEDSELKKLSWDRHKRFRRRNLHALRFSWLFTLMFTSGMLVRRTFKKLMPYKVFVKQKNSPFQILNRIAYEYGICGEGMTRHIECTTSSSFWNMLLLSFLASEQGGWNRDVYADFAFLMSSCADVVSADVPAVLEKLGLLIQKSIEPEKFKKMSDQEAYEWLQNSNCEASRQFQEFLATHGHRCLKEFDLYSTTWGDNPMPLVKMLKDLVGTKPKKTTEESSSFSYILPKLHMQLNFWSRLKFRLLLPNCKRGVRERELSKSLLILTKDKVRKPFHMLANAMVREGYLPHRDMLFFLCIEEINQLIKTRSPRLVARAFKRWKCHEELDKLFFPEIMIGTPKPINSSDPVADVESAEGLTMHGVPVSPGVVKGIARVVVHLSDATNIQPGDILITYSTDIGWSPYFPLLSGVVTELGGLISHGAVVAREYGLPCVVALHGAIRVFKSGDVVVLDGNKGVLKRVES